MDTMLRRSLMLLVVVVGTFLLTFLPHRSQSLPTNVCKLDTTTKDIEKLHINFTVNLLHGEKVLQCTGIIIDNLWVLAPASCLSDHPASEYKIRLVTGDVKDVRQIIINEDYNNERGAGYDLALVQSSSDLINSYICALSLVAPQSLGLVDNNRCVLVKRDKNNTADDKADHYRVQKIEYHSISSSDCLGRFKQDVPKDFAQLLERTECYGSKMVGVCRGETGAMVMCPLVATGDNNNNYYPMALSSWGDLFCKLDHYDYLHIFTKINYPTYRRWIEKTTQVAIN